MGKVVSAIIGWGLVIVGLLGVGTFAFPELAATAAFKMRGLPEPFAGLLQKWFHFSDYLQKSSPTDYFFYLFIVLVFLIAGVVTLMLRKD